MELRHSIWPTRVIEHCCPAVDANCNPSVAQGFHLATSSLRRPQSRNEKPVGADLRGTRADGTARHHSCTGDIYITTPASAAETKIPRGCATRMTRVHRVQQNKDHVPRRPNNYRWRARLRYVHDEEYRGKRIIAYRKGSRKTRIHVMLTTEFTGKVSLSIEERKTLAR